MGLPLCITRDGHDLDLQNQILIIRSWFWSSRSEFDLFKITLFWMIWSWSPTTKIGNFAHLYTLWYTLTSVKINWSLAQIYFVQKHCVTKRDLRTSCLWLIIFFPFNTGCRFLLDNPQFIQANAPLITKPYYLSINAKNWSQAFKIIINHMMFVYNSIHGRRQPPWIFIHGTDRAEGGLMVLFFGLVFSVGLPPGNFSADALNPTNMNVYHFL